MNFPSFQSVADQLLADLKQERELVNLIIRGCIEYRWAVDPEEQAISKAIVYNAFEAYTMALGMPLSQAEAFCEQNLDNLIQMVLEIL